VSSTVPDPRQTLLRQGRALNAVSLSYNGAEAFVALGAGLAAGSISLVGFGIDSTIELAASLTATWRLTADTNPRSRERAEFIGLRIIGALFLMLAVYVAYESIEALVLRTQPAVSPIGIALAAVSAALMPWLARAKRRVAEGLGSGERAAEAQQTLLCSYLSWILLGGLLLNALFGWWWADPLAALAMVPIILREGWDGVRGKSSCACHTHAHSISH
jgi:divalent metal cation (Fe/Co/Zn/Cd) transporter